MAKSSAKCKAQAKAKAKAAAKGKAGAKVKAQPRKKEMEDTGFDLLAKELPLRSPLANNM